ncbi:MAG: hypothetical protein ACYSUP_19670 [Planctomycetota bacterium]
MLEHSLGWVLLILGIAMIWPQLAWCISGREGKGPIASVSSVDKLSALAKECEAEVGFYGKNFTTGKTVEYQPGEPACLASVL